MEATSAIEGEIMLNAVETEATTQSSEIKSSATETPKIEQKNESRETSEPPSKKCKTEASTGQATGVSKSKEPPVHEMVGGSSVRQYLNKHLTEHLLEGLKQVSKDKPEDPLLELGKFLISRSEELKKR
ncbi:hypothetical protein JCM33374_g1174 [Metschnikowia sp. JCM 33374]|nr:hypothetical protein JCM33374_g1174 [Metschnikowia sp. JCM 33374]